MVSLTPHCCAGKTLYAEKDDDIVIVTALRTPICKAKRGGFKVRIYNVMIKGDDL